MKILELTPRRIAPLVLLCCLVWLKSPSLHAQDFKFTDFSSPTQLEELALNGSAVAAINGSGAHVLRITPAVASPFQVGSAWFCGFDCSNGNQELLAQGFSTTFKFQLSGSNTPAYGPADGFAFVIQSGAPNACFAPSLTSCGIAAVDPTAGGTHGYDGLTNSLAVEFVTYRNIPDNDIPDSVSTANNGTSTANEVGIQSCGTAANTANTDTCDFGQLDLARLFFSDGTSAATTAGSPTVTLTGTPYTLTQMQNMAGLSFVINGLDFGLITATNATAQTLTLATAAPSTQAATVTYAIEPVLADGNVHTVTITDTPTQAESCVEEACSAPSLLTVTLDNNVVLSTPLDIVGSVLGGSDGALVGFTGSSASGDDNQDILSWTYDTAKSQPVTSGETVTDSYDGGADTWTIVLPQGLPAGAMLTAWRTELTQADWAQRVAGTSYVNTTLAPINAPGFISPGDGAVWSAILSVNGVEYNPATPAAYALTGTWTSSDNNYLNESPGQLKAHPTDSDNWTDIYLSTTENNDPVYTNKGGSKTPCSDYANVSGVTGTPPAVTITSPADGSTYTPNQIVDANFSCSGNSVTGCVGILNPLGSNTPVNFGAPVDTSVNGSTNTFSVVADVSSGPSGTGSATYHISSGLYGVQLLYASNRVVKSGADFPIRMYLTDVNGNDVSSSTLIVHALEVILVSTNVSDTVTETGGSNPDLDFRFDGTQGPKGGFDFNLKTTGLGTGQYVLQFQVIGDIPSTTTYTVPFGVK
jgi:hypothetical protein